MKRYLKPRIGNWISTATRRVAEPIIDAGIVPAPKQHPHKDGKALIKERKQALHPHAGLSL
ncbi:MAG: hypothetical protein K9L79_08375 [Methylobacter tundripaludum]|nr:hypothetical protein [Methylobacter tundripaludum]